MDSSQVVSLYVCDFPQNLETQAMVEAFSNFEGFVGARIARDKTGQKIAFVDFDSLANGEDALNSMVGFKFLGAQRGMNIRISDKSKRQGLANNARHRPEPRPKPDTLPVYKSPSPVASVPQDN